MGALLCSCRYGSQPGKQELTAEYSGDPEITSDYCKDVASNQTKLPDCKEQVILLQMLEWEPGFQGDIWYSSDNTPGTKQRIQYVGYDPDHDQTHTGQDSAYTEPEENSKAEQKVTDTKMGAPENEGDSEIQNDYNSYQTNITDCEIPKQESLQILDQELDPKEENARYSFNDTPGTKQRNQYVGYDHHDQTHTGQESAYSEPESFENFTLSEGEQKVEDTEMATPEIEGGSEINNDYTSNQTSIPDGETQKQETQQILDQELDPKEGDTRHGVNGGDHSEQYVKKCKTLMLRLCAHPKTDVVHIREFSETTTIGALEFQLKRIFHIPNEVKCRVRHGSTSFSNPTMTLKDAGVFGKEKLILEKRNGNGTWPKEISSPHTFTMWQPEPRGNGLCGLANLGNTCFMNSALQCLSNTQPLTDYFVGKCDAYENHINRNNSPLGMNGAIAEAYGAWIKEMWSGNLTCVHPHRIKAEVQKYAPQFIGYNQQDAQELLTFLLNGIHEDLNLVKDKPYFDMTVNTEGKLEEDVAEESWYNYLRRNQSVIVKVFQGLLKSTLDCPRCRKKTWVFDPFTFLSLPLPATRETRCIIVTLMRAEHQEDPQPDHQILRCKVTIPKKGYITDLKKELTKLMRIASDKMIIDVYNNTNQTHRIVCDQESLSLIPEIGTFVHELSHPIGHRDWVQVPVYHRFLEDHKLFGSSVVVSVQRQQCTKNHIYEAVLDKCRKYVTLAEKEARTTEESDEQMEIDEPDETEMDTEENECIDESVKSLKEMSIDGEQKTVMFELEVGRSGEYFQDFEVLKHCHNPITSGFHIYCTWSHEVMKKCYDIRALDESIEAHESYNDKEQERRSDISLSDCLDLFTKEKSVGIENAWYCPDCKQPVRVSKKCDLWKLPEILIIYLKRFCYNRVGLREKIDAMVDFPISDLSFKSYDHDPDDVYDLFATINHVGGLTGGHYTACCKNSTTGSWYTFDDTRISEVRTDRIMSATAYVLFYQRRSECHTVNNGVLADLFAEEMHHLEAKFKPRDTDKEQEATNEEGNKEAREESEQFEQGNYKEEREAAKEQLQDNQSKSDDYDENYLTHL